MRRSRSSFLFALLWFGLVLFSLRPLAPLEAASALLVSPLRWAGELASPLGWLRRSEVRAAERRLALAAAEEALGNERLLRDLARHALPVAPELVRGRRLVPAEVRGRARRSRDRIEISIADPAGVVEGLPVVCGDAYVGRVARVGAVGPDGRATVEVELVTAAGFHVGAEVRSPTDEPVLMTVGGVDSTRPELRGRERHVQLAVHNPSDRELESGFATVHELFAESEQHAELSEGFRLGRVQRSPDGRRWTVDPELDYVDGLFHVVVLAPPGSGASAAAADPVLLDPYWVPAEPLGPGSPSPWREGVKVTAGAAQGVRPGAAVIAIGARLVGRVTRVSRWSADVSFLGDPGFSVVAVARVAGEERPRILGRLVSLGRDREDRSVLLRWVPRVAFANDAPAASSAALPAELFTGAGDGGLSNGFYLGRALIPPAARAGEPHVIRLLADVEPRDVHTLFVRAPPAEEVAP